MKPITIKTSSILVIFIVIAGLLYYITFECPKCASEIAIIELIDQKTQSHIINNVVIIRKARKHIDTLYSERDISAVRGDDIFITDSSLCVGGEPGLYSFKIQTKEYKDIYLDKIKVPHVGNPFCKMAAPVHFILKLKKDISDTSNCIIKKEIDTCCD
jgi:hypothetical protein